TQPHAHAVAAAHRAALRRQRAAGHAKEPAAPAALEGRPRRIDGKRLFVAQGTRHGVARRIGDERLKGAGRAGTLEEGWHDVPAPASDSNVPESLLPAHLQRPKSMMPRATALQTPFFAGPTARFRGDS